VSLIVTLRLPLAAALVVSAIALAADGGSSSPDAGAGTPAAPDAGNAAQKIVGTVFDAGTDYFPDKAAAKDAASQNTAGLKTAGGSHCKVVRVSDHKVLVDKHSAGSIMDCQEQARAETLAKFCKKSRERIDTTFAGEWNSIAMEPISMHIWCPRTDLK